MVRCQQVNQYKICHRLLRTPFHNPSGRGTSLLLLNKELREINKKLMVDTSTNKDIYKFLSGIIQQMETLSRGLLVLNIEGDDIIKEEDWIR